MNRLVLSHRYCCAPVSKRTAGPMYWSAQPGLIRVGGGGKAVGLLNQPGVVHEDDRGVVGEELSVHVGPPVAIGAYGHPVQACAGQVGFDPGSVRVASLTCQNCLAPNGEPT